MKRRLLLFFILLISYSAFSQDMTKFHLYKPGENAEKDIASAVQQAKAENKFVLVQVGGNWCIWCARFNDFITTDKHIDSLVHAGFVVYHMNYSKENFNAKMLAKYEYPQRFGFPVFLILDGNGKLIHTQNSAYLEDGKKSYDREKVIGFFNDWSPKALDPTQYKEQ